jgi:hypothetical protein
MLAILHAQSKPSRPPPAEGDYGEASWIPYIGFMPALAVLIGGHYIGWRLAVLPIWVLLISLHILLDNLASARRPT